MALLSALMTVTWSALELDYRENSLDSQSALSLGAWMEAISGFLKEGKWDSESAEESGCQACK